MLRIAGAALLCALIASPCLADNQFNSSGASGAYGRTNGRTGSQSAGTGGHVSNATGKNSVAMLPTYLGQLAPGGLPPTKLDSFVKSAGGSAEMIYGDEGTWGIPPYFEFTQEHRIGSGISSSQLSTGHASTLPSAWGYAPGESGYSGGYDQGAGASFSLPAPTATNPFVPPAEPVYNPDLPNNVYSTAGF